MKLVSKTDRFAVLDDMLPGELHAAAFARYCAEHDMTFLGSRDPTPQTEPEGRR